MSLDQTFHEAFVAWTTRHREELDRWEAVEKAAIASLAEFHRRGIGQLVRQARIRLIVAAGEVPHPEDPDFHAIYQALHSQHTRRTIDALRTARVQLTENLLRFANDAPLIQETP